MAIMTFQQLSPFGIPLANRCFLSSVCCSIGCSVAPDGVLTYIAILAAQCRAEEGVWLLDTLLATLVLLTLCTLLSAWRTPCRSSPFWLFGPSLATPGHNDYSGTLMAIWHTPC